MSLDAADSPESIHRLGPGLPFKGRLLLVDKQRLLSRNSQPYLALVLRDRDGEIQGRAFRENAKAAFEALEPGAVVDLSGRTQTFHGQAQIDIFNAQHFTATTTTATASWNTRSRSPGWPAKPRRSRPGSTGIY